MILSLISYLINQYSLDTIVSKYKEYLSLFFIKIVGHLESACMYSLGLLFLSKWMFYVFEEIEKMAGVIKQLEILKFLKNSFTIWTFYVMV